MRPTVAVLTPVFRHAQYLAEMLRSLQAQTMEDWECAVVLDGPDKEAEDIAMAFSEEDLRINVIALARHKGLPAARNLAARATTAPWLLPFDADDIMEPRLLEMLLRVAEMHSEVGVVVFTPATCLKPDGSRQVHRYPTFNVGTFADQCQITGAALRRRVLWEAVDGWDEAWTDGAEDWHFYCRAISKGLLRPIQLHTPLWTYRQHDGARNSRIGQQRWPELQPKLREAMRP